MYKWNEPERLQETSRELRHTIPQLSRDTQKVVKFPSSLHTTIFWLTLHFLYSVDKPYTYNQQPTTTVEITIKKGNWNQVIHTQTEIYLFIFMNFYISEELNQKIRTEPNWLSEWDEKQQLGHGRGELRSEMASVNHIFFEQDIINKEWLDVKYVLWFLGLFRCLWYAWLLEIV